MFTGSSISLNNFCDYDPVHLVVVALSDCIECFCQWPALIRGAETATCSSITSMKLRCLFRPALHLLVSVLWSRLACYEFTTRCLSNSQCTCKHLYIELL